MTNTLRAKSSGTVDSHNENQKGTDPYEIIEGLISREVSDYTPTTHFRTRVSPDCGPASSTRTNPPITGEVIDTCIAEGAVEPARRGTIRFVAEVDGHEWCLFVQPETARVGGRVLTAYVPGRHRSAAVKEGDQG